MGKMFKLIGKSGQITLGKKFAGKKVMVVEKSPGYWIIRTGEFIPDDEIWLHQEPAKSIIDKGLKWAEKHAPEETDMEKLSEAIRKG